MAGVGGGEIMAEMKGSAVPVDGAAAARSPAVAAAAAATAAAAAAAGATAGDQKNRQHRSRSIYQVPEWIRKLNSSAYTPRFVSFGPYHNGAAELKPMEKHKRTARTRFLLRANKNPDELKRTVEDMVDDLMDSYDGLDKQWRNDRDGFLDLMVLDGCFMLELLIHGYPDNRDGTTAAEGYAEDNPVFGNKGAYLMPHIRRDMLLLENQLPLQLLERLAQLVPAGVSVPFLRSMISSTTSSSLKGAHDHHHFGQLNAVARMFSQYDRDHDEACFLSVAKEQYWNVQDMALRFLASGKLLLESGPLQMALPTPSPAGLLVLVLSFYVRPLIDVLSLVLSPLGRFCLDFQRHLSDLPLFRGKSGTRESEEEVRRRAGLQDLEGIHILDVYKKSMLLHGDSRGGEVPFSAQQLSHFGVKLKAGAEAGSFRGIDFGRGKLATEFHFLLPIPVPRRHLRLPVLKVDADTLPTLLNLMAFERLHHGTGDEVNNYLLLMCSLVRSVEDVEALYRRGIVVFGPGHNERAACDVFTELARQALPTAVDVSPCSRRREMPSYADRAWTACPWPAAAGGVASPRGKLYTEVATYCSTRGARTVRWLRLCRPPPFMAILLSMVAISVALFTALSNHVIRMRR